MTTKAVGYVRVSTAGQEDGFSPEAQKMCLRDYAKCHDIKIVKYFRETHSAYRPGRPVFEEMVGFLEERQDIGAVVVYKLDRLARNIQDFARMKALKSVRIISATEQLGDDAPGRLLSVMMGAFAEFFSDQLSERASLGMKTKASNGMWPSSAPTGYLNDANTKTIVPDPIRAPLVVALFERCAQTRMSLQALTEWAEGQGLRTRRGGAFRKSGIHKLLHNSVYWGPFSYGGKLYEGTHEPLITKALFDRVQERLAERSHSFTKRSFPYRGLLTCAYCGCKVTAAYAKKARYIYYRCTHGRGSCDQNYIRQDRLSEQLLSVVEGVHLSEDQLPDLIPLIQDSEGESKRIRDQRIAALNVRRQKLEERCDAAYRDKLDGHVTEDRWRELDQRWSAEALAAEEEIDKLLSDEMSRMDDPRETLRLLNRAPELYLLQSHEERARLLDALIWNCRLSNESADPTYRSPFDLIANSSSPAV